MPRAAIGRRPRSISAAHRAADQAGFTLIELMITVAILGVLASVAIPTYTKYMEKARHVEGVEYVSKIANGAIAYYQSYGGMPVARNDDRDISAGGMYPTAAGVRQGFAFGPPVASICNPDPAIRAAHVRLYFHSPVSKEIFVWDKLMFQPEGSKLRYYIWYQGLSTPTTANGFVQAERPRDCNDLTKGSVFIRAEFRREGGVLRKVGPWMWRTFS